MREITWSRSEQFSGKAKCHSGDDHQIDDTAESRGQHNHEKTDKVKVDDLPVTKFGWICKQWRVGNRSHNWQQIVSC